MLLFFSSEYLHSERVIQEPFFALTAELLPAQHITLSSPLEPICAESPLEPIRAEYPLEPILFSSLLPKVSLMTCVEISDFLNPLYTSFEQSSKANFCYNLDF